MVNCKNCQADCANKRLDKPRKSCLGYSGGTNADRIRAMSDEELADNLWSISHYTQKKQKISDWLDWLKSEVET